MLKLILFLTSCTTLLIYSSKLLALTCLAPTFANMVQSCENIVSGEVKKLVTSNQRHEAFYEVQVLKIISEKTLNSHKNQSKFYYQANSLWGDSLKLNVGQIALFCLTDKDLQAVTPAKIPLLCNPPILIKD